MLLAACRYYSFAKTVASCGRGVVPYRNAYKAMRIIKLAVNIAILVISVWPEGVAPFNNNAIVNGVHVHATVNINAVSQLRFAHQVSFNIILALFVHGPVTRCKGCGNKDELNLAGLFHAMRVITP